MAAKSICLILIFGVGLALSQTVQDYWCKYMSSANAAQCVYGTSCPSGYTVSPYGNNQLACFSNNNSPYTCCVPNSEPTTTPAPPVPPTSTAECGTMTKISKLINGEASIRCQWPWLVSIRGRQLDTTGTVSVDNTVSQCAGVLIDDRWVITTAFCVFLAGFNVNANVRNNILIVAGEYNTSKTDVDYLGRAQEQEMRVVDYFIHPSYPLRDSTSFIDIATFADKQLLTGGNVALLKLASPVTYTECIKKACYARDVGASTNCGNDECYVAGWGLTQSSGLSDVPLQARVETYRTEACESIARYSGNSLYQTQPATFCASALRSGTTPCLGDNGGMVICNQRGRYALHGLVAKPQLECDDDKPFIASDVTVVQDWIDSTIALN
ncbi:chymotrypsinogen A [Patella vulgata]|uniref:chymotrypsinogen A n=1 Tax=Patella vulgata TaxID=6465 RepID=UPI00218051AB|nr:chymotrypsinogen A [Patella vulgata]